MNWKQITTKSTFLKFGNSNSKVFDWLIHLKPILHEQFKAISGHHLVSLRSRSNFNLLYSHALNCAQAIDKIVRHFLRRQTTFMFGFISNDVYLVLKVKICSRIYWIFTRYVWFFLCIEHKPKYSKRGLMKFPTVTNVLKILIKVKVWR